MIKIYEDLLLEDLIEIAFVLVLLSFALVLTNELLLFVQSIGLFLISSEYLEKKMTLEDFYVTNYERHIRKTKDT